MDSTRFLRGSNEIRGRVIIRARGACRLTWALRAAQKMTPLQEQLSYVNKCQKRNDWRWFASTPRLLPSASDRRTPRRPLREHGEELVQKVSEELVLQERSQPGPFAGEGCGQERGGEEEVQVLKAQDKVQEVGE